MSIRWSRIHAALGRAPQDLTYEMVTEAVAQGVAETDDLDWKSDLPPADEKKKWEFAKDVATFANTRGGLLVYGVTEKEERATGTKSVANDERARQRLRAIANRWIRPYIAGLEFVALDGGDGQATLLVVSVPASADAPHIVGERNEMGVPFRSGTDTVWMSEAQLERAYDDRRLRRIRDRDALDVLLTDLADEIQSDEGAWLLVAARPSSPIPGLLLSPPARADVALTLTDAHAQSIAVSPVDDGHVEMLKLFHINDIANPRIGLRRWIVQTNRGSDKGSLATLMHVALHHDGAVTMAMNVRDGEALDKGIGGGEELARVEIVESAVLDAVALATAHARRVRADGRIALKVALVMPEDGLAITRDHRIEPLAIVPGSRVLTRLKPVTGEVSVDADAAALRTAVAQLVDDVLHQFGVTERRVLHNPD
jgi:hypothetical protein